jgi:hypothetical protein
MVKCSSSTLIRIFLTIIQMSLLIFLRGNYINRVGQESKTVKNVLLTFGNHYGESIQFIVGKFEEKCYVILHYVIKLMEDEKGKVEVDELDLGYCLIHVLYIILPCGFTKLLGVYKVGK